MKLLISRLAWKRWAKKACLSPNPSEPKEYPCYAMSVCTSCQYEESDGFYLYHKDLDAMATQTAPF